MESSIPSHGAEYISEFPPYSLPRSKSQFDSLMQMLERGREIHLGRGSLVGRKLRVKQKFMVSTTAHVQGSSSGIAEIFDGFIRVDSLKPSSRYQPAIRPTLLPSIPQTTPCPWDHIDPVQSISVGPDRLSQVYQAQCIPSQSSSNPDSSGQILIAKFYVESLFPYPSPDELDGTPEGTFDNNWQYATQWARAECVAYERLRGRGVEGGLIARSYGFYMVELEGGEETICHLMEDISKHRGRPLSTVAPSYSKRFDPESYADLNHYAGQSTFSVHAESHIDTLRLKIFGSFRRQPSSDFSARPGTSSAMLKIHPVILNFSFAKVIDEDNSDKRRELLDSSDGMQCLTALQDAHLSDTPYNDIRARLAMSYRSALRFIDMAGSSSARTSTTTDYITPTSTGTTRSPSDPSVAWNLGRTLKQGSGTTGEKRRGGQTKVNSAKQKIKPLPPKKPYEGSALSFSDLYLSVDNP
ncbi:hypothetical protein BT96DRAFT_999989 [Gymnopus androsaceus JB14]|uniref:Uncharacterized protein n=1 Tax=Gymnopus androsaceus JB14 TaxID=1447944 RepID=A0A6A4H6Q3_9AGAR|nr:hypothetical protein BT96DRAFT_999989 [Gymnopus androsaceus JB14]